MIMDTPLESWKILAALATFRILQEPIYFLPQAISMITQTKVSLDRIASFLSLDDMEPDTTEKLPRDTSDQAVEILDGNFAWDPSATSPTLKDINLRVNHGMRVALCGMVGSGKSTLLSCILGEVPNISGTRRLSGFKAYVPQSPWIQSGKIVDNILFGREMDIEKYNRVLEACSLTKDLEILSFGDQTIIGERGVNLSGGQKQRVQIARALYQDADIYLFDDPFSAVDAHTGSHLFKECLLGLLESKTVIYVTHQVEFLPAADLILVMKDGRLLQAGKYDDLLASGTDFKALVGAHEEALSAFDSIEAGVMNPTNKKQLSVTEASDKSNGGQSDKIDDTTVPKGQLVQEEEREKGKVGFSVYWKYLTTAYGGALVPIILICQILFQALQILSNYWMAWATPVSTDARPVVDGSTLIIVYVVLALGSAFCLLARSTLVVMTAYKTATLLFSKMHQCIFRAPMSFFEATPCGRILNRASTDQSAVDVNIPNLIAQFAFTTIQLLGIIGVMSQVAWWMFLVFLPVVPGIAGLAVTYGLNLNNLQGWMISFLCEMENTMISVERILQYTSISGEPPLVIEENSTNRLWPSCGEVNIQDLQVRYAPHMPLVLRGITCTFGGKKTGIVGRTGSGKTTLILALFRIVEPAAGHIVIDGINISSIGLHDLRSRLSIIPQDPTMFEGTIRSNFDPLEEYTDEQIWEALDKCQLGDEVRNKQGKLDSIVSENGENWSLGQRQLVCLGRVLLKKSKVLVLDEATASVDTATDNLIQQTLREHFSHSTFIIIAHRITSIINSNMVVLLSDGLVEECDSPSRLLENNSSSFTKLVAEFTTRSQSKMEKLS